MDKENNKRQIETRKPELGEMGAGWGPPEKKVISEDDPVAGLRKLGFKFGKAEFDKWKPNNRNLI